MTDIVFVDVKTTSLRPDRRAWEIAMITEDGKQSHLMIMKNDLDLANADPASLKIGGFYERHEENRHPWNLPPGEPRVTTDPEKSVAKRVEEETRGKVLCGVNVQFDALTLDCLLRRQGLLPAWHHRLLCVRSMAIAWLVSRDAEATRAGLLVTSPMTYDELVDMPSPELSRRCGVEPPSAGTAHTALGDARWAAEWFYLLVKPGQYLLPS